MRPAICIAIRNPSTKTLEPFGQQADINARSGGWMAAPGRDPGEESPGSMETRCRVTPGGGDPRESATESKPPSGISGFALCLRVRVKGCGKSAPQGRQRFWHGKPHLEQDQVGTMASWAWAQGAGLFPGWSFGSVARGARRRASQRNGHPAACFPQAVDRTRLTGHLIALSTTL